MRIDRLVLALLVLLAACRAGEPPTARPALWEIGSAGGARGYVFGTIHAMPAGLAWQSRALTSALAESDRLVLEIAADGRDADSRQTFLALATSRGLVPLEQRVAPRWREKARAAVHEAGLDQTQFLTLEDWAAALTLSVALQDRHGFDPANGAERALAAQAGSRPIVGLETVAGQLGVFDGLPAATQRALLDATVAESAAPDHGRRLLDAWASGDVAALARETHSAILADPRLRAALLVDRNRAWAARIAAMLNAGQRPFVAVGAAHVVGAEGLPALLAERGFTVRRVQ